MTKTPLVSRVVGYHPTDRMEAPWLHEKRDAIHIVSCLVANHALLSGRTEKQAAAAAKRFLTNKYTRPAAISDRAPTKLVSDVILDFDETLPAPTLRIYFDVCLLSEDEQWLANHTEDPE